MHPDPTEPSSSPSQQSIFGGSSASPQHGLSRNQPFASASPPYNGSAYPGPFDSTSPSEWSLSPSTSASAQNSPTGHEARLSTPSSAELDARDFSLDSTDAALTALDSSELRTVIPEQSWKQDDGSVLNELPDEMLFHVMSHLPAADLLTVKLVSRRFHTLVTSPLAWMNAFSKFFPGPDALLFANGVSPASRSKEVVKSEQRRFNRLTPSASWSSEYLTRTRLLRCLERGRPALPFASPAPGKPGKGSATFSFSTRLRLGCSNLHADFGTVFDKRKPQFVHGFAANASVSSSDRKGKFDSWGFTNHVGFAHFSETHPGHALYGLEQGAVVGVPNMMDVSQRYGMVYGEGKPGGTVFHLGAEDKHGITLAPFLNVAFPDWRVPKVTQDSQATCAVWIAKSSAVPQMTRGMIGMLAGSSSGVISAYSLGPMSKMNQRFARGQLTARWLLSPGVPIIAITADDNYSQGRADQNRIWAVALNALGEVFYLKHVPAIADPDLQMGMQQEVGEEIQAWASGNNAKWMLVKPSLRASRYTDESKLSSEPGYLPSYLLDTKIDSGRETPAMSAWISRTPGELRSQFFGWDMRRHLQVDFAAEDDATTGEAIFVFSCGHDESAVANVLRYVRSAAIFADESLSTDASLSGEPRDPSDDTSAAGITRQNWSFAALAKDTVESLEDSVSTLKPATNSASLPLVDSWQQSNFGFGGLKNITITATALDESHSARSMASEDQFIRKERAKPSVDDTRPMTGSFTSRIPGQRARFLAIGTGAGNIMIWNSRAPASHFLTLTNDVQPLRVINTDSPGIASLAMSALYLVHGGSEGLVQAWDPLASTLEPLRTLSSRQAMNSRRRAVIASQQNAGQQGGQWQLPLSTLAAGAIQLDPDPHVLRGVVVIGPYLKYWSYSSVALAEDLSRSQKRRMRRTQANNQQINGSMEFTGVWNRKGRRAHPHHYIDQEVLQHKLERRERVKEEQHERRMAGRFGLDLLGENASEDEMLAYAKLLSEEENERQAKRSEAAEARVAGIQTNEDLEAQRFALSEADAQKWKFASWEERYKMLPEGMAPSSGSEVAQSPSQVDEEVDEELKRALELSLHDENSIAPAASPAPAPSTTSVSRPEDLAYDPDLAEAIALSMSESEARNSITPDASPSSPKAIRGGTSKSAEDDELARAIQMSLQVEATSAASASEGAETSIESARPSTLLYGDSFPALSPSPSPGCSPALNPSGAWRAKGSSRDKGKGRS